MYADIFGVDVPAETAASDGHQEIFKVALLSSRDEVASESAVRLLEGEFWRILIRRWMVGEVLRRNAACLTWR